MSVWRRGPVTKNPYLRTAFRVLKASREVTGTTTLVRLISQAENIAATNPRARSIRGEPVTLEEISSAQTTILDPEKRILEELLVHATERPSTKRLKQLARMAAEAMAEDEEAPPRITNWKALRPWLDDLMRQCLADATPAEPIFGAMELAPVPPLGRPRRE